MSPSPVFLAGIVILISSMACPSQGAGAALTSSPSPAPAPAPAPSLVNLTQLLGVAGPFHTFLSYLTQTQVIETFQSQANNTQQGLTLFVPTDKAFASLKKPSLANLTEDQLKSLLLYHAFPHYYSLSDFKALSSSNPVSTFAGNQYTLNLTYTQGVIHVDCDWSNPKISSSVYSTYPCAVYEIQDVLLPDAIFGVAPPLPPAPAPAPDSPASDLAPEPSGSSSAGSKPSKTSSPSNSTYGTMRRGVSWYYLLALVASGVMAILL